MASISLPTLLQRIELDVTSVNKATSQVAKQEKEVKRSFEGISTAADALTFSLGSLSFIALFKGAIESARNEAKQQRLTAAAVRSTGGVAHVTAGQIEELAKRQAELTGIDREQIQTSENMLLRFTSVRNEVGKGNDIFTQATKAIQDVSAATGKGLTPVTIALGKALNDPTKGLGLLARSGIQFTKSQTDAITAMVKSGHLLQAQKTILAQVQQRFGGAAAAAADPIARLNVLWKEGLTSIGGFFLPALNHVVDFLTRTLVPAADRASEVFGRAFSGRDVKTTGILSIITRVAQAIRGFVLFVTGNTFGAGTFFARVLGVQGGGIARTIKIVDTVRHVLIGFLDFVKRNWSTVGVALASVFLPISTPLVVLVVGISALYHQFSILQGHAKLLIPVLIGVATAFATMKTVAFAQNLLKPVAAIAKLRGELGGTIPAIRKFAGEQGQMGQAVSFLLSPTGAIIALIVGLAVAFVYAYRNSKPFHDLVNRIAHDIVAFVKTTGKLVVQFSRGFVAAFRSVATTLNRDLVTPIRRVVSLVTVQWNHLVAYTRKIWPQVSEAIGHILHALRDIVLIALSPILLIWTVFHKQIMGVVKAFLGPLSFIVGGYLSAVRDEFVIGWHLVVAVVGPILRGLIAIIKIVFGAIGPVVSSVLGIVRGIIQTVLALINGDWGKAWDGLKGIFGSTWNLIFTIVKTALRILSTIFGTELAIIVAIWNAVWGTVSGVVTDVFGAVWGIVKAGLDLVASVISAFWTVESKVWSVAWNVLLVVVSAVWNALSAIVTGALNVVSAIISGALAVITTIWNTEWRGFQIVLSAIWGAITAVVSGAINGVRAIIALVLGVIVGLWNNEWHGFAIVISAVWGAIVAFVSGYINAVRAVIAVVLSAITGNWSRAWNGLVAIVFGIWGGIRRVVSGGINGVVGLFRGIGHAISSAMGDVGGAVTGVFRAAWNGVARLWNDSVGKLGFSVPSWVPGLGGKGFHMPSLPTFDLGGLVPGPFGAPVPILAHGGEVVVGLDEMRRIRAQRAPAPGGAGTPQQVIDQHQENTFNVTATSFDQVTFERQQRLAALLQRRVVAS